MADKANKVRAAILGASGYTGAELVRLLAHHPSVEITALTAKRHAGKAMGEVFPHLGGMDLPQLTRIKDLNYDWIDAAFCALPHGTTHEAASAMPERVKVIDLSPDFRLADTDVYESWYGPHNAPKLQKDAVYGISELARDDIAAARIVACPGCYPTSGLLPLVPLVEAGLIEADDIIVDAKSGVTGAGREPKEASLYAEVSEGIQAYGIAGHRHGPEFEQALSAATGRPVKINFTPHLMPMNRGILSTIYVRLTGKADAGALREALDERYGPEPFVRVVPEGVAPATRHVRGSNHCLIGVFDDRIEGRAILVSVIDNLVKGASGQAVQNMNLVFGLPETAGLEQEALFP